MSEKKSERSLEKAKVKVCASVSVSVSDEWVSECKVVCE